MSANFVIYNGPMQTTAGPSKVATGASIKTLLQVAPQNGPPGYDLSVLEWGISFDGSAAATPILVEFIQTDVNATVTASVNADVTMQNGLNGTATPFIGTFTVSGTNGTGYTASAEGSIGSVQNLDGPQLIAPTNQFMKQFPLGARPTIQRGKFGRIRVTAPVGVNALCYMVLTPAPD